MRGGGEKKSANPFRLLSIVYPTKVIPSPIQGGCRKWLRGRREHKGMGSGCTRLHSHACILALHPVILPPSLSALLTSSQALSVRPPLLFTQPPPSTLPPRHCRQRACTPAQEARKDTCLRACPQASPDKRRAFPDALAACAHTS